MAPDPLTLTCWLDEWRNGDPDAANHLFAAAWPELSRLTAWHLREHPDHALRSDALLNELYGELFAGEPVSWQNRAHFFEVASGQLRRVLIDHARARAVGKRDGGRLRLSLTEANGLASPREEDLVDLHEALNRLDPPGTHRRVTIFRRLDRKGICRSDGDFHGQS